MTTSSMTRVSPRLATSAGPALMLGGLLWVYDFAQIIVNGLLTGSLPTAADPALPLYLRIGIRLLVMSVLVLGVGLVSLWRMLYPYSRKLCIASAFFMAIAFTLATINIVTLSGLVGTPAFNDSFMGLSIFATAIATGLLSVAALRTGRLPRPVALTLLFVGVATIPILFGTPLPIGPDWATDHLAFLVSGLAYTVAGTRIWRAER